MNETLREKEELSRIDTENLRKAQEELSSLRRKVEQHGELMAEKDRTVQVNSSNLCFLQFFFYAIGQILHDEISTALLELSQVEERNQGLAKDNAKLLQRWLDAKQAEANRMNEDNERYENMRSRHDEVLSWRDNSHNGEVILPADAVVSSGVTRPTSASGKGSGSLQSQATTTKNGPLSPASKKLDQTPNG